MAEPNIRIGGPLHPLAPAGARPAARGEPSTAPFQAFLDTALRKDDGLRFSAHALQRLEQRGIHLQPEQLDRLRSATDMAGAKGSRDTLMLMDGLGMIVNVPNRTVITAVATSDMKESIFTNIDSAVLVK